MWTVYFETEKNHWEIYKNNLSYYPQKENIYMIF